jgi:hypothetical protein
MLPFLRPEIQPISRIENVMSDIQNVHLDEKKSGASVWPGAEEELRRVKTTRPNLRGHSAAQLFDIKRGCIGRS